MKYRRLGRTEMEVSVVGVGTWQFGGEWGMDFDQASVNRILGRAQELGINLIDTAECYGDHLSERLIGAAIKGQRDQWIIATKFGHQFNHSFDRADCWSPDAVRQQLEDSLRALQTDYVDLYQFHSGANDVFDQPELWEMLAGQVRAGKVRHLGLSISPNSNIYQARRAQEVGAEAIQVVYNRLDRTPEAEVLPTCQEDDLGVLARVPLASGFLSGKYKPGDQFTAPNDVRSRFKQDRVEQNLLEVERIREMELPRGVDMAGWALAWCLMHPAVTCVIPGMKSVAQVEADARAAMLALVRVDHPQAVNG